MGIEKNIEQQSIKELVNELLVKLEDVNHRLIGPPETNSVDEVEKGFTNPIDAIMSRIANAIWIIDSISKQINRIAGPTN